LVFPGNIGNLKEVTERGGGGGEREKKRQIKKNRGWLVSDVRSIICLPNIN
jgi:hypothetical protein